MRGWRSFRGKWATEVIIVAVLYCGAASLSLRLAFEKTNASPVWPPSGIALVAVLLLGYRVWPGIMLGAVLANVVAFLANQAAGVFTIVVVSSVIGIGNTLEALVGKFLLHRWVGAGSPFDRAQDVFKFTAVALLTCLVSASIGPTAVALAGLAPSSGYGTIWFTWWLGDATGVLLVTPLLITWSMHPQFSWTPRRRIEAGLLLLSLALAAHVGFGGWLLAPEAHYPLVFVPLPWLVWSAFRFDPRGAATAAAVTSGIAIWDTVNGLGPFVRGTVNESLLLLQAFVGIVTVTILTMAAVVAERREAHDTLETRVAERTRELVQEITERRSAEEVAERRRQAAESLAEVGRRISQSLDPRDVAQRITRSLRALLGVPVAVVYRLEPASGHLVALGLLGDVGPAFGENLTFPVGTGGVGRAVSERRVITSLNVLEDPEILLTPEIRPRVEQAGYRAVLALPLQVQDTVIGALEVGDRAGRVFEPEEIELVQAFADQAAIALENARLYERAQQAYAELSRTQAQLLQTQKMEAIGRLAAGVAHDFNNLLTVISGRSQLILRQLPSADPRLRDLELIQKTCARAARVVEQLLAFSRKQILKPKVLDLNAVIGGMMDMLRRLIGEDVELAFVPGRELGRVRADLGQLEQVIVNLAVNARDAMPEGGRWTIETANVDLDGVSAGHSGGIRPGAYVRLAVSDTGVGMDESVRARLFEPFFTTKELGTGTGLGLASVYGIVEQGGGAIRVYSEVAHGTTFKIYLPRVQESAEPVAERRSGRDSYGGTETVLVVEDEDDVRTTTSELLDGLGYTVLEARRPHEALLISEQHLGPIHLMLTDVVMPDLNGHRLAARITSGRPSMKVLYMSGYTDDAIVRHGVLEPGTHFLPKPFSREALADKVRDVLDEATKA